MSIIRINEFQAAEAKATALFDFLKSLIPYISSSEGCLSCEVLQNSDDEANFLVIETWESLEFHKKSVENFPKDKMQAGMSLLAGAPKAHNYHS